MISQQSIQDVLEAAKIEEVVGDFVNLRRRGVNMIGLCPFHNEKTPSFSVSPAKNIFKCFGCARGGTAVQFVMELENLSFPDAIRYLAKKYRIELEETQATPEAILEQQALESLYLINQFALEFFQEQLLHTDLGKSVGLSYFRSRGFREETIRKFGLG
ncbi:MAG: CHC2 zinc finger domain-containing protein, partial [Haliscomenobacter sp.]